MSSKLVFGLVVALLLGIGIASLHRTEEVYAQKPDEVVAWEYKVVAFTAMGAEKQTEEVNKLAADGWQYVGLLTVNPPFSHGNEVKLRPVTRPGSTAQAPFSTVLFKRQKR